MRLLHRPHVVPAGTALPEIFRVNAEGLERLEDTIAEATTRIYIRTGDLVCMELAPRKALWESAEGVATISGTFCENNTVEFNIK